MTQPPLYTLSARALVTGYGSGDFTPLDALAAIHSRIDEVNGRIVSVIAEDRGAARAAARASADRWAVGTPLSALDGVPLTIKDNLHVAGLAATWGSRLHAGDVPTRDEPALGRLRAAGAIFVGKTNVPEFTLHGYTDNDLFGPSRNPLALRLTPGGSTGGGAAGVAAGICPVTIGTDGGGSTRRPAAHCGLWGFKPSLGRIARRGGFPQILADFEVIGCIGRDPRDLAAVFGIMAVPDSADPRTLCTIGGTQSFSDPLRIGYFTTVGGAPVDPEIVTATEAFVAKLSAAGAVVRRVEAPFNSGAVNAAFGKVAQSGLAWHLSCHANADAKIGCNAREIAELGRRLPASELAGAMATCHEMRGSAGQVFEDLDLLVCPTTAALAWPAEEVFPPRIAGREVDSRGHALFTTWVNITGLCAASVPMAETPDRGGVGVQLIAGHGRDAALLDLLVSHPVLRTLASHDPERAFG